MLTFTSLGGSSVRVVGGAKSFVIFPRELSNTDVNLLSSPQEFPSPNILSWPGEYDVGGLTVRGIGQQEGQKVSYVAEADGYRIATPASELEEWTESDIERLGDVHVMVLPAENLKVCQQLIDEVDPRVLLLVPGQDGKMDAEVLKFCGAVGKDSAKEFKMKSVPAEGREVVVLG